jgi:hypothetical protein
MPGTLRGPSTTDDRFARTRDDRFARMQRPLVLSSLVPSCSRLFSVILSGAKNLSQLCTQSSIKCYVRDNVSLFKSFTIKASVFPSLHRYLNLRIKGVCPYGY